MFTKCQKSGIRQSKKEDAKIARLEEWKVPNYEEIFDRFHIICGRNIFNIESIIKKKKAEIISKGK